MGHGQNLLGVDLGHYKLYKSWITGGVPMGLEVGGDCKIPHQL